MAEYLYLASMVGFLLLLLGMHYRIVQLQTDIIALTRHLSMLDAQYDRAGMDAIKENDQ